MLNNSKILHNSRILNNSKILNNSRILSAREIEMTSLVSTSRYSVSHPSSEYTLQWSQLGCAVTRPAPTASVWHRLRCRHDPHQWPSDVGIHSWICNMNVARVKPREVQVQI